MQSAIRIESLTSFSKQDVDTIRALTQALGKNAKPLTDNDLKEIITSPITTLIVAREQTQNTIVGMTTLAIYRIPYVKKAYLDDLIVAETHRGHGIGSQLLHWAASQAKKQGAAYIDFTSRPRRGHSNKLYNKLGFSKRDTYVYRLLFDYAEV